eukprot:s13939_g1.t1
MPYNLEEFLAHAAETNLADPPPIPAGSDNSSGEDGRRVTERDMQEMQVQIDQLREQLEALRGTVTTCWTEVTAEIAEVRKELTELAALLTQALAGDVLRMAAADASAHARPSRDSRRSRSRSL